MLILEVHKKYRREKLEPLNLCNLDHFPFSNNRQTKTL